MPRRPASVTSTPSAAPDTTRATASVHSTESIAQDLASAIAEKRLPPGTWLREEALGRVYSVSRTKVRAALLTLSRDKLVEIIPDKGAFVSRPSVAEAREVFAMRRLLEAEAVRLFVQRAKPEDYERLEQHVAVERRTLVSATAGSARERLLGDFHVVLAEACGNQTLAEVVREMVNRSSLIAMLYHSANDPHCSSDEHDEFLRIARSGDAERAVHSMLDHLGRIEASLQLEEGVTSRQTDLVKALLS